jgi:hypothetical protein
MSSEEITINEGQENVKIFATKNVGIEKGSQIDAYLHSQASIDIKHADASKKTTINGILIATKIKSGGNVVLKGQPTDCSHTTETATKEDSLVAKTDEAATESMEEISIEPSNDKIIFGPNPSSDFINISLPNMSKITNVKIGIRDTQGRLLSIQEAVVNPTKMDLQVDLRKFQVGLYLIELKTPSNENTIKVQVLR